MRTKEVEEAIKTIQEQKENVEHGINAMECRPEDYDEDVYNDYIELKKKAETLLSYIEKLEQLPNKIRDKIKELDDYYKKEVYPIRYQWADIDITEFYDSQIELLNELLEN